MTTHTRHRIAIGTFFFFQGLCFASWATRIPEFQKQLHLSEAALGSVLFAIPMGQMFAMPITGWMIDRLGSRRVLILMLLLYVAILALLSQAQTPLQLSLILMGFGFAGNLVNISVNAQAVSLESAYNRPIMATFHGFWSLAGFFGGAFGTAMLSAQVSTASHFLMILIFVYTGIFFFSGSLIQTQSNANAQRIQLRNLDSRLLKLGVTAFCAMSCEGAMFDWSGVYFKKVIQAEGGWIGVGYTAFLLTMASGRFVGDRLLNRVGFQKVLEVSGITSALGFMIPVLIPNLFTGVLGFLLVGAGVSSMVPLIYSAAGKSKSISPGVALSIVSSIGFLGFLLGPPLIGWSAQITSLRISFALVAILSVLISVTAKRLKHT